jgi:hypothetical protein
VIHMPESEQEKSSTSYSYPMDKDTVSGLAVGDRIKNFPMNKVMSIVEKYIAKKTADDANEYGDLGGNMIQHGNMRAMVIAADMYDTELNILKNNNDTKSLKAEVILPKLPNQDFWGRDRMVIRVPYGELYGPLAKASEFVSRIRKR